MHKIILMMLLAVISSSAMAGWVKIGGIDTQTAYYDPSTIRKEGNKVIVLEITDFSTGVTINRLTFLSVKTLHEYDCKEEQEQILNFTWHSGKMGGGNVVYTNSEPLDRKPVSPDSMTKNMWKAACGKK